MSVMCYWRSHPTRILLRWRYMAAPKKVHERIHSNLHVPRDGNRYKARKLQGLIRSMEELPPAKFDVKGYILLLNEFDKVCEEIRKDARARGVDARASKRKVQPRRDEGAKQEESSNVGPDVSTEDTDTFSRL